MKQLLLSLLTFFLYIGCTENRIASKLGNTYPDIFPDYKGISIPINIAPLNFTVRNSSHIKAVFSNNNQPLFSIENRYTLKEMATYVIRQYWQANRYIHIRME